MIYFSYKLKEKSLSKKREMRVQKVSRGALWRRVEMKEATIVKDMKDI